LIAGTTSIGILTILGPVAPVVDVGAVVVDLGVVVVDLGVVVADVGAVVADTALVARVISVVGVRVVSFVTPRAIGVVGEVSAINSGFVVNLMKASWSVVGSPALLLDTSGIVKNQRFFDDLFLPHTEKMPYCFRDPPNFAQTQFFS
jgi:hypothetical protein